jgi:hypothetical protein
MHHPPLQHTIARVRATMRWNVMLSVLVVLVSNALAIAEEPEREIRRSPDGRYFVGWFDYDAGAPFGMIRPIVFRSATDPYNIFSLVSSPRYTDASWNPASSRCVIADAPDNGGPKTWLVYQKTPQEWATREIAPFAALENEFYKADPKVTHLFRPSILKITWLSETEVQFRGYCNSGTYLITVDTAQPKDPPTAKKLSDAWLEE